MIRLKEILEVTALVSEGSILIILRGRYNFRFLL